MINQTNAYAAIIKQEKLDDGTLLVYGKATDDSLDIDQQICDASWLEKAMPEWFRSGGNIREQHSNIAAGVAKELNSTAEGHYISALVVDPVSVKKVETGVLKGFSIGIRAPRIVRDNKAANGRIIDGQIVEVSLVDRPANPNAKLMLAKCDNEQDLIKVEEFEEIESVEKHGDHDQSDHNPHAGGEGRDSSETAGRNDEVASNTQADLSVAHSDIEDLQSEMVNSGFSADEIDAAEEAGLLVQDAQSALERAQNAESIEAHKDEISSALDSLTEAHSALSEIDSGNAGDIQDYLGDMAMALDDYLSDIDSDYESVISQSATAEIAKGEKMKEKEEAVSEKPSKESALKRLEMARKRYSKIEQMCKELGYLDEEKQYGESAEEETEEGSKPTAAEEEVEEAEGKSADATKCLECGCHQPANPHGGGETVLPDGTTSNMTSATMVSPTETPKSTIVPPSTIEEVGTIIEEDSSEDEDMSAKTITAIIEKAVKSAKDAVTAEIGSYQEEINKLHAELATAKSKAVAGGPKRSVVKTEITEIGDYLAKAADYRAKAASTSDADLARGYRELAEDAELKAKAIQAK